MELPFCVMFPKYGNSYYLDYLPSIMLSDDKLKWLRFQHCYILSSLLSTRKCSSYNG